MLWLLLGLGAFFVGIGFLVHAGNAKYLLAGYNTMSEAEQKKVDLSLFLPYFRHFHWFLGVSFVVLGLGLYRVGGDVAASVFVSLYPLVAYMYFMWRSRTLLSAASAPAGHSLGIWVMALLLAGIAFLLYRGMQPARLELTAEGVVIHGMYGERLAKADIEEIAFLSELPDISHRKNGVVLGHLKKGYFRTQEGAQVKLLIDTQTSGFVQLTPKEGGIPVIFSSREQAAAEVFLAMSDLWPELVRN